MLLPGACAGASTYGHLAAGTDSARTAKAPWSLEKWELNHVYSYKPRLLWTKLRNWLANLGIWVEDYFLVGDCHCFSWFHGWYFSGRPINIAMPIVGTVASLPLPWPTQGVCGVLPCHPAEIDRGLDAVLEIHLHWLKHHSMMNSITSDIHLQKCRCSMMFLANIWAVFKTIQNPCWLMMSFGGYTTQIIPDREWS